MPFSLFPKPFLLFSLDFNPVFIFLRILSSHVNNILDRIKSIFKKSFYFFFEENEWRKRRCDSWTNRQNCLLFSSYREWWLGCLSVESPGNFKSLFNKNQQIHPDSVEVWKILLILVIQEHDWDLAAAINATMGSSSVPDLQASSSNESLSISGEGIRQRNVPSDEIPAPPPIGPLLPPNHQTQVLD